MTVRQLARAVAAAGVTVTLAASPALARIDPPATPAYNAREAAPPVVVVRDVHDGFDWGAAALGAGTGGALVVIGALAGAAYTTRHRIGVAR